MNRVEKKAVSMRKTISLIQEFMIVPQIIVMKENNFDEYSDFMKTTFPEFSSRYEALFGLVISGDNISILNIILNGLIKESRGEITRQEMEHEVGMGTMDAISYQNEDLINKMDAK
jgi:hypothetical protein